MPCLPGEELRAAAARVAACWDCLGLTGEGDSFREAAPDLALSLDELSEEVARGDEGQEAPC